MIPMIASITAQTIETVSMPSYTYRWDEESISGFVDGELAIQQTIVHILNTERYAYPIYPDSYGVEMRQYNDKSFDFIKANIGTTIYEALIQDDRILDVIIESVEQPRINTLYVAFSVQHTQGTFREEVTYFV